MRSGDAHLRRRHLPLTGHAAARAGSRSVGRADIGFDSGVEMSRPSSIAPIRLDAPS